MALDAPQPRPYSATELQGVTPIWLLEIEYAGRTLRYSTYAVDVTTEAGETVRYGGRMPAVTVEERAELLAAGDTPIAPTASVEILPGEDIAALVEQGHRLDMAFCRLSWWAPGTTHDRRMVVIEGYLRGASYGGDGEPITGTIEPEAPRNDDPVLPATWRIGPDTEIGTEPRIQAEDGTYYPLVVGSPGYYQSETIGAVTVTQVVPAYRAPRWERDTTASGDETTLRLLLTGGRVSRVGDLRVIGRGTTNSAATLLAERMAAGRDEEDALGQPITHAALISDFTESQREATDWYVAWDQPQAEEPSASGLSIRRRAFEVLTLDITPGEADQTLTTTTEGDLFVSATLEVATPFDADDEFRLGDNGDASRFTSFSDFDLTSAGTQSYRVPRVCRDDDFLYDHLDDGSTVGAATLTVEILPAESEGVRTLGQALLYFMLRTRVPLDLPAWVAVARRYPQPIAGVVTDGEMTYWDLLQNHLLPLAPISLRWGPRGLRPVVWPWLGLAGKSLRHLTAGEAGVVRLPDVRYASPTSEMVAGVRVEYSWNALASGYNDSHVLTADPVERADNVLNRGRRWDAGSGEAEIIRQRLGDDRVDKVSTRWVYRRETAAWVARWRLALLGIGYRHITMEGPPDLGALDIGDVVTVTDSTLRGLTAAPAIVVGRRLTDAGRVGLELAARAEQVSLATGPNADDGPDRPNGPELPAQN